MNWFTSYFLDKPFINILDILLVWYLIYFILKYVHGTRAMNVLKGVAVIAFAKFISNVFKLETIDWILQQVISWAVVGTIVLFQPEIRKGLESLGRGLSPTKKSSVNPNSKMIQDIVTSVQYMSKRKIGALISIESEDSLDDYIQTGIPLDAKISHQLITNTFIPNTPLHDGAMIIANFRIKASACYLPLSDSLTIPKELGTRHRAAIGLSESTDALTIIVSEETGGISLAKKSTLHRDVSSKELQQLLSEYLTLDETQTENEFVQFIKKYFVLSDKSGGVES